MELATVDLNPKQNRDPTFYCCVRPQQAKDKTWLCVKGGLKYVLGKEEVLITSVPNVIPSLLHKPYLTVSLSNPVKIVEHE